MCKGVKMSKIKKLKKVLKKTLFLEVSEHNALISKKKTKKFVIVFFLKII
jgi:hypothetical protein